MDLHRIAGDWAVPIVVAIIGAGGLDFIRSMIRARREEAQKETPEGRKATHLGLADKSLLILERTNTALSRDLDAERRAHAKTADRYEKALAAERARNDELRRELRQVEEQLRQALAQVDAIKTRHKID